MTNRPDCDPEVHAWPTDVTHDWQRTSDTVQTCTRCGIGLTTVDSMGNPVPPRFIPVQ